MAGAPGKSLNLTAALLFLAAFVIGLPRVFVLRPQRQYWVLVLATFLGLLGFLDEMSFGGRIFVIDFPQIFDAKFDGIHDLFYFAAKMVKVLADKFGYIIYISIIAAGPFIVTFIMTKKYATVKQFYYIIVGYTPYYFLCNGSAPNPYQTNAGWPYPNASRRLRPSYTVSPAGQRQLPPDT